MFANTGDPRLLRPVPVLVAAEVAVPGGVYDGHELDPRSSVLQAVLGADSVDRCDLNRLSGGSIGRSSELVTVIPV